MVPGAATGAGPVPGPCPSVGVVMAAVVCWPLTRRVKMPQNQGKCFIARYKLQRRSWNNNGAPNGGRPTHTHREKERWGAREGDRVRERALLCVEESCSSIGSIFCARGHTRSAVPGRGKCLGNRMFKVKKRMCSALNPAPTLEASSCCYVDRVTGGRSRRWQHWMYHRRRRRRGTKSGPAVTEAAPYNLFSAHQRVSLALSLSP